SHGNAESLCCGRRLPPRSRSPSDQAGLRIPHWAVVALTVRATMGLLFANGPMGAPRFVDPWWVRSQRDQPITLG
ncbi:MAG: hypothetical protein VKJ09_09885, partial [Leptolyngbya sp.]|nr:hypothetical protein [Leptolyngbya sp.]